MKTKVCEKDFVGIINTFTKEEVQAKYGKLVIERESNQKAKKLIKRV